jgi:hypothetical protein
VAERYELGPQRSQGLVDILDRILDKGLVVAGDIKINLANVELLTIRIRLLVCSIDKAEEIGMNWWRRTRTTPPAIPRADCGAEREAGCAGGKLDRSSRSRYQAHPLFGEVTWRSKGQAAGSSLIDVLDRVLDKGIVIDAYVRVSLVGIDLVSVEARIVVASVETYLKFAEAIGITGFASRPMVAPPRRREHERDGPGHGGERRAEAQAGRAQLS